MATSESGPVRLDVQASVQATEEEEKVRQAIQNLFPAAMRRTLDLKSTTLRGHYHNPIIRLTIQITKPALVTQALTAIGQQLSPEDRIKIQKTLTSRINQKGQLFLRLNKQEAYQGRVQLINRGDSIRLVVRFSGRKLSQNTLEHLCRQFNLI
ncbi:MAG: RNA-binding domain-containing protein [Promethearchaeota archaeon]